MIPRLVFYRGRHARRPRPLLVQGHRVLFAAYIITAIVVGFGLAIAQQATTPIA